MTYRNIVFHSVFLIIACILCKPLQARQSVDDFLLTAFEDPNLATYDARIQFIRPSNYRIPVLDELELRWGNDEQTKDDIQYAMRVRPSNPWLIRRNNALFNATRKEISLRKKLEFRDNLFDRYNLLAEYFYYLEWSPHIQQMLDLKNERARLMEENIQSDLFDANDYAESRLEQVESIENLDEAMLEMNRVQTEIELLLQSSSGAFRAFNLISVATIDSLAAVIAQGSFSSSELELIAQEMEVARQEVRVEKADFDLGYFQVEYFPFRDRNSDYGFAAGVTIPIFRNNRPQIAERKLDEMELQNEYRSEAYSDSLRKVREYSHLRNLLNHHKLITEQIEQLNLESLAQNLANSEDYDPFTLIGLEEGILDLQELALKSRYRIIRQYLEFLYTHHALSSAPLKNYLSEGLSPIQ